jgi:hypothetical protein
VTGWHGTVMITMTMDEPPQDALGRLQWAWGTAYQITGASDRWVARRSDNGRLIAGGSPDELRELLKQDYEAEAVPREVAP